MENLFEHKKPISHWTLTFADNELSKIYTLYRIIRSREKVIYLQKPFSKTASFSQIYFVVYSSICLCYVSRCVIRMRRDL